MTAQLSFTKPGYQAGQLLDEILQAVPALRPRADADGRLEARVLLEHDGDAVRVVLARAEPVPPQAPPEPTPPPAFDLARLPAPQRRRATDQFLERYTTYQQAHAAWQGAVDRLGERRAAYEDQKRQYDQRVAAFEALRNEIQAVVDAHTPAAPVVLKSRAQYGQEFRDPATTAARKLVILAILNDLLDGEPA